MCIGLYTQAAQAASAEHISKCWKAGERASEGVREQDQRAPEGQVGDAGRSDQAPVEVRAARPG